MAFTLLEGVRQGLLYLLAIIGVDEPQERPTVEPLDGSAENLLEQWCGSLPAQIRCKAPNHLLAGPLKREGRITSRLRIGSRGRVREERSRLQLLQRRLSLGQVRQGLTIAVEDLNER